jgi:hypothetical protein
MTRPKLNQHTTPDDFLSFYWLKEELIRFLREHDLSTTGSKQDLTSRINLFLETGTSSKMENKPAQKLEKRIEMPKTFTRQSVIGSGWRCSQELRAFFSEEIGRHFHFDAVMRNLIHNETGKTLEEAIEKWEEEQHKPVQKKSIAPQFEYNRYLREYFKSHPGAKLQEGIRGWKIKKKERRNGNETG